MGRRDKRAVEVANLKPAFVALLNQFDIGVLDHDLDPEPRRRPAVEEIGAITAGVWHDIREQVEFVGETVAALAYAVRHPSTVRWRDVWVICERVGADALPIAAILLAGRSGAAFAAEIGTMKVNQEVDALTTMGLDPVRFLVTTRVIAAILMTPLLTLFADLVSLLGGALTLQSFSIPFITFVHEVEGIVDFSDFMAGWIKSFIFAILIAGIGCLRGLQTSAGASSVGDAATRAVVSGIILLVVVDGVFAVVYFFLDI